MPNPRQAAASDHIPVVYACDEAFVPYTAASIQSLMETADPQRKYCVYLIITHISENSARRLLQQVRPFGNFSLEFLNVERFRQDYEFFISPRDHITIESWYRLFIPDLFPEHDRVIYLDGDTICCTDVAALHDMDMGDFQLAAARDMLGTSGAYERSLWGLPNSRYGILKSRKPDDYFIAGLVVFNLRAFRQRSNSRALLELAVSRNWPHHDQDVLNVYFEDSTLRLPMAWNFTDVGRDARFLPEWLLRDYLRSRSRPKVVHFGGYKNKPWKNETMHVRNFHLFWKYALRSEFAETIVSRMKTGIPVRNLVLDNVRRGRKGWGLSFLLKYTGACLQRLRRQLQRPPAPSVTPSRGDQPLVEPQPFGVVVDRAGNDQLGHAIRRNAGQDRCNAGAYRLDARR